MQVRKVAILLGLIAISALSLFVATLVDGSVFGAEVKGTSSAGSFLSGIDLGRESVNIGPGRNCLVEISAVFLKGSSGDLLLPFVGKDSNETLSLSGPLVLGHDADSIHDGWV